VAGTFVVLDGSFSVSYLLFFLLFDGLIGILTMFFILGSFSCRLVGGYPGPDTDSCVVYDHAIVRGSGTPQWSSLPPLPNGRAGGSLVYITAQHALFFTGGAKRTTGVQYEDYQESWLLPLNATGGTNYATWIVKPNLPFFGNHMSYVAAKDNFGVERYFFMGGQLKAGEANGNQDKHFEYVAGNDIAMNGTWIQRQKMPFPRGHANAATKAISCGFIIVGGAINSGQSGTKSQTTDVSYYAIPTNTWTKIGDLPQKARTICGIDFVNNYLYCETGFVTAKFSQRRQIIA
jgi:hypothetical protein